MPTYLIKYRLLTTLRLVLNKNFFDLSRRLLRIVHFFQHVFCPLQKINNSLALKVADCNTKHRILICQIWSNIVFLGNTTEPWCSVKMLNRFIASFVSNSACVATTVEGLAGLGAVGMSHQYQQVRQKSKIKFCGYLEPPEFKKRDIRYKTSTRHDPKRMNWHDYQVLLEVP